MTTTAATTFNTATHQDNSIDTFVDNSKVSSSNDDIITTNTTFSDDDYSFDSSEEDEKLLTPPIETSSNLDQMGIINSQEEEEEDIINDIQESSPAPTISSDVEEEQDIDWGKDRRIINILLLFNSNKKINLFSFLH